VRGPIRRMIMAFDQTLREYPPIAPGAPDGAVPSAAARAAP
jgi:hypothetical protein